MVGFAKNRAHEGMAGTDSCDALFDSSLPTHRPTDLQRKDALLDARLLFFLFDTQLLFPSFCEFLG